MNVLITGGSGLVGSGLREISKNIIIIILYFYLSKDGFEKL